MRWTVVMVGVWMASSARAKDWLDTPYTAAQIRDALPEGARFQMRVTEAGAGVVIKDSVFVDQTRRKTTVQATTLDGAGAIVESVRSTYTWVELQRHARFTVDQATRTRATIESALGTYEGWRYDIDEHTPDGATLHTQMWFADKLPGPPLRLVVGQGPDVVYEMEMLSRTPMPSGE